MQTLGRLLALLVLLVRTKRVEVAILALMIERVKAATDMGMIAYFEKACPEGWEEYKEAQDRFILTVSDVN